MHEIVFAIPVAPGKEDLDRRVLDEIASARRDDYDASLGDCGIVRQAVWHQETPEAPSPSSTSSRSIPTLRSDSAPRSRVNAWFRAQMKEVHGVDISQPLPPVRKVHDSAVAGEKVA